MGSSANKEWRICMGNSGVAIMAEQITPWHKMLITRDSDRNHSPQTPISMFWDLLAKGDKQHAFLLLCALFELSRADRGESLVDWNHASDSKYQESPFKLICRNNIDWRGYVKWHKYALQKISRDQCKYCEHV